MVTNNKNLFSIPGLYSPLWQTRKSQKNILKEFSRDPEVCVSTFGAPHPGLSETDNGLLFVPVLS